MIEIIPAILPKDLDELRDKMAQVSGVAPLVQIYHHKYLSAPKVPSQIRRQACLLNHLNLLVILRVLFLPYSYYNTKNKILLFRALRTEVFSKKLKE